MKKTAMLARKIMPWIWAVIILAVVLLPSRFLYSHTQASLWCWDQVKSDGSEKMASWVTAVATCVTAIGVIIAWYQIRASRRSARFAIIQERFNDPAMRFSRAAFAWGKCNPPDAPSLTARFIPLFGWDIIKFLNSVGKLVEERKVEFEDVEMAYARHVSAIFGIDQWKQRIGAEALNLRYAPLLNLHERIKFSGRFADESDELEMGIFNEPFWHSEMSLAPEKEIKDAVNNIREKTRKRMSDHRT